MEGKAIRRLVAGLFGNILFVGLYTAAWLSALILIYFFWDVSMATKVIATIPLIFLTPTLDDLVAAWKGWRQGRSGVKGE